MLFLLVVLLPQVQTSRCITNYGKTICGYSCLAAHGDVACARTPSGICASTSDTAEKPGVVCWDPPESVRAHYGDLTPLPQCVMRKGNVFCGYGCVVHGDEVACAQTPDGICRAGTSTVVCWDPPYSAYCADNAPLPRPQCILVDGEVACGYKCEARNGNMACAQTPGGKCNIMPNDIICFDPEAPAMCGYRPCTGDTAQSERWWCRPGQQPNQTSPTQSQTKPRR